MDLPVAAGRGDRPLLRRGAGGYSPSVRVLLTASLLALGLSASAPASARAEACGRVTEAGLCEDAKTLVFCEDDALVRVECPADELCVIGDERFAGVAACVATALAECEDFSEEGTCAGTRSLVYCDERGAHEERCAEGSTCAWVDEEDWFACVPDSDARPEPVPEQPGPAEPLPESPGTEPPGDTATDATPAVTQGGAPPAEEFMAGGSGCGGGASTGLPAFLAAFAGVIAAAARRARA